MNTSTAPVPGVFHFIQHSNVSSQDWHWLCQAITTAYQQQYQHPDTLGLTLAPAICEYTGNRPLRDNDNLIGLGILGLGMIGFNGDRTHHQAGDPFILYRRQTPHAPVRCDTRGYPYQWLVMAALLLVNTQCPNTWTIESDIPVKQWRKVAHWLTHHCQLPVSPLC